MSKMIFLSWSSAVYAQQAHERQHEHQEQHNDLDDGYLGISRFIRVLLLGVQQLHPQADGASALGKHQLDKHRQSELTAGMWTTSATRDIATVSGHLLSP